MKKVKQRILRKLQAKFEKDKVAPVLDKVEKKQINIWCSEQYYANLGCTPGWPYPR